MALFLAGRRGEVRDLVRHLSAGTQGSEQFAVQMRSLLVRGHAYAGYLGRRRAGDLAPYDQDDTEFGQMLMADQQPFLDEFVRDLDTEKYEDEVGRLMVDPIERRALMYVARMVGTANEALVLATPASRDRWWWKLGGSQPCPDCPRIAAGSPYTSQNLPGYPGSAGTACKTNCRCELVREDGVSGFVES